MPPPAGGNVAAHGRAAQPKVAPGPSMPRVPPPAGGNPRTPGQPVQAAQPKMGAAHARTPVVQRFKVLGPEKLMGAEPPYGSLPWFGYPYAVVNGASMAAQAPAVGVGGGDEFLTQANGNVANVVNRGLGTLLLRVSNDDSMAIEESNLTNRQPKVFYATTAVVNQSNLDLANRNSSFRLATGGQHVTILTGWSGGAAIRKQLYAVTPQRLVANVLGAPDTAPQNCNAIASEVTGIFNIGQSGETQGIASVNRFLGFQGDRPDWRDLQETDVERYARSRNDKRKRREALGINEYADPEVGDAYMIFTNGRGVQQPNGTSRVRDYVSGEDRDLGWNYHFGGVVAKSGGNAVTLENYARGDMRVGNADPRWYFQMYGKGAGQSFHAQFEAKRDYANPITVAIKHGQRPRDVPSIPRLGDRPELAPDPVI